MLLSRLVERSNVTVSIMHGSSFVYGRKEKEEEEEESRRRRRRRGKEERRM